MDLGRLVCLLSPYKEKYCIYSNVAKKLTKEDERRYINKARHV